MPQDKDKLGGFGPAVPLAVAMRKPKASAQFGAAVPLKDVASNPAVEAAKRDMATSRISRVPSLWRQEGETAARAIASSPPGVMGGGIGLVNAIPEMTGNVLRRLEAVGPENRQDIKGKVMPSVGDLTRRGEYLASTVGTLATMVPAPEFAAEEVLPEAARAAPEVLEDVKSVGRFMRRPVETAVGGPKAAGIEDVFRASVPGAGSKNINLRENVQLAANDLAEIERKTPLIGKGGVVRPDLRLREFSKNVGDHMSRLWNEQVLPQIARHKDVRVSLQPIKDAMRSTITQTDIESSPAGVRNILRWANRIPETDTLEGLQARRQTINAYLRQFERGSGSEQARAMETKPLMEALKAQDVVIKNIMFDTLHSLKEPGIDMLEKRYAALSNLKGAAESQMNQAEAFRLFSRVRYYLNPKNLVGGLHEGITSSPTSGRLMQKGMRRLKRAGLGAPEMGAGSTSSTALVPRS